MIFFGRSWRANGIDTSTFFYDRIDTSASLDGYMFLMVKLAHRDLSFAHATDVRIFLDLFQSFQRCA